jgi:flagellar hook-basal body complex protein FliE
MSDPIGRLTASLASRAMQGPGALGDAGQRVPFTQPGEGATTFGDTLTRALNEVSDTQDRSEALTGAFLRGEPVELHQVTAAAEEASLSLELLVELRNKFTEAYRTVINMQS